MDIISMAQQARPKDMGQIELRRAQLTTLSSEEKRIPSFLRKFSSSPGFSRVTPLASSTAIFAIGSSECARRNKLHRYCASSSGNLQSPLPLDRNHQTR